MRRNNKENFTQHSEVSNWYDQKFTEMGGSWYVPPEELDYHLDLVGLDQNNKAAYLGEALELGCGDGKLMERIIKRGRRVTGIDISDVARKMTLERLIKIHEQAKGTHDCAEENCAEYAAGVMESGHCGPGTFVTAAMENLPFNDWSFDWALSYGSMEHALDIPKAVSEMARVLRTGGRFNIYAPNEEWIHDDQPLETTMTADEWQSIFDTAGLTIEKVIKNGDNNIYIGVRPT